MKNKKLLRAIAALTVGSAMAAGCLSFTACGGGHTHTWSDDYYADGANGHYQICTDCDEHSDNEAHTMVDGECTVCHWKSTTTEGGGEQTPDDDDDDDGEGEGEGEGDGEQTSNFEVSVAVNATSLTGEKVAAGNEVVAGSGIYAAKSDLNLSASTTNIKLALNGEDVSISAATRLQLGGQSVIDSGNITNALKVNVQDNAKIIIYAVSASSAQVRSLALYNGELNTTPLSTQSVDNSSITTVIFEVEQGGTYYVGCPINGVNIYYIAITYSEINETVAENVKAVPADCTNAGNIAYTVSNFGRIKNSENEVIVKNATILQATGHSYEDAEITISKQPTESEEGTATLNCDTCDTPYTITLPELTSDKYDTTSEGAQEGNLIYSFVDDATKRTITFEAEEVTPVETVTYSVTFGLTAEIKSSDATAFPTSQVTTNGGHKQGLSVKIDNVTYTYGVKLNSSGYAQVTLNKAAEVKIYIYSATGAADAALKATVDGEAFTTATVVTYDAAENVYTLTYKLEAGKAYKFMRGGSQETALLRIDFTQVVE